MQGSTQTQLLNIRKLKKDFAPASLKEGQNLYEKNALSDTRIESFSEDAMMVKASVLGAFNKTYRPTIEIDRQESEIIEAHCSCTKQYDCEHIAALLFYLEHHLEQLVVNFFNTATSNTPLPKTTPLKEVLKQAEKTVQVKQEKALEKQLLEEYRFAIEILAQSSLFTPKEEREKDLGELWLLFTPQGTPFRQVVTQLYVKLPFRTKPIIVQNPKKFFTSLETQEPVTLGSGDYTFSIDSFGPTSEKLLRSLRQHAVFTDAKEHGPKSCLIDKEGLGELLFLAVQPLIQNERENTTPLIFWETFDQPLILDAQLVSLNFSIHYLEDPLSKIILFPHLSCKDEKIDLEMATLLESRSPGVLIKNRYHRFSPEVTRQHLIDLALLKHLTIPEQLFGTFIENALPHINRVAHIHNQKIVEDIVTLPYTEKIAAKCDLAYLDGQLEANMSFQYGNTLIPESKEHITQEHITTFITPQGILARNVLEEAKLAKILFSGFEQNKELGTYVTSSEKKIVEFMTEVIPQYKEVVSFSSPDSLQNKFVYDETTFTLELVESAKFDRINARFSVKGPLIDTHSSTLWDCVIAKKPYIVLHNNRKATKNNSLKNSKILVLKLDSLATILQIFDELQIEHLVDHSFELPLWVLVNLLPERFEDLPIKLSLSKGIADIQNQIFNGTQTAIAPLPKTIKATLRSYQVEGVNWLCQLRNLGLNGILADDMGLGKTLQSIVAITQYTNALQEEDKKALPTQHLIICPTSLVDNWLEELQNFNPNLRAATVTGTPQERKKLLSAKKSYDVLITSYGLLQKDIEFYEKKHFGYVILDEAQNIKNRDTQNAKSVKKISARHKLILTGTPLENSLEDLWSLFDFLMPGLLGSFDCFMTSYIRSSGTERKTALEILKKKISPFVLRRMKKDVLEDLPPISHIVYHCHLSPAQQELYTSYAKTATENLIKLVEKEGFDKVRIHILATLTRLKQICCHPAIFAKDAIEANDSAKYDLLMNLLSNLTASEHKTVLFSQYTKMLNIIRQDLDKMGIPYAYLDGSTKNRLSIVKQFNEDQKIPIFLVSLKAGGSGLNLTSADTVIHYDMWWNPAVENQATDRVWRLGQKQKVSSYKLVTLGTIEEKIVQLQDRKKELLLEIVKTDEEGLSKLTWDEVLELLSI